MSSTPWPCWQIGRTWVGQLRRGSRVRISLRQVQQELLMRATFNKARLTRIGLLSDNIFRAEHRALDVKLVEQYL